MRKFDQHWNCISSVEQMNWTIKFVLILKSWERRQLWVLSKDKKTFTVNRDPDKHTLDKLNAYWFNVSMLEQLDPECKIVVKQKWTKLKLTAYTNYILTAWIYLFFLQEWFEKQIFLKKELFNVEL